MTSPMLRKGLWTAALLAGVAAAVAVAGSHAAPGRPGAVRHSCGALDRQFVRAATLGNTAIGQVGQGYLAGDLTVGEAIGETRTAAAGIAVTSPRDPTLRVVRTLMRGMFAEYGRALRAHSTGGDAGSHMFRSYTLANLAHQALADARPELERQGCSLTDLLQQ